MILLFQISMSYYVVEIAPYMGLRLNTQKQRGKKRFLLNPSESTHTNYTFITYQEALNCNPQKQISKMDKKNSSKTRF